MIHKIGGVTFMCLKDDKIAISAIVCRLGFLRQPSALEMIPQRLS
jgi:hypothetical protein